MTPISAVRHARGPNPKLTVRRPAEGVVEAVWVAVPVRVLEPEPVGEGAEEIVLLLTTAVAAYSSADW